ncbi:m7GpppX diphosphatase [Aethina tumida]|uniref:m7GpppX diphosphatase n=1 Tax=Aethina tumida TaxID=116153 RepID=UPI0021484D66|nr:m7GpppX diphosphatase [Aethina tumida]
MESVQSENACSPAKKLKVDDCVKEYVHDDIKDLSEFKLDKIINNNTNRKSVCLKGTFASKTGDALVLLEKTAFAEESLLKDNSYFSKDCSLEKIFHNDIYGDYRYFPKVELNGIKATIIHPATEKHIVKFSAQKLYIVDETPKIYNEIVQPFLMKEQFNLQWVFNILEHKSEADRIVFEDTDPETGFVLIPDLKWSGELDTFYLLAIVNKRNIKSLRDLTPEHLPLLKNIQEKACKIIEEKYKLEASQLRIYLHYQPSFYHLHIHFCYLRHEAPGILAEKAHLLSNVISNIEIAPDYYKKVTLPFTVRENDNLFTELVKAGIVKKFSLNND